MKELLYKYKNGDFNVSLYDDGTKIREWDDNIKNPQPTFPESIDLKITNKCDIGCRFCHENSTLDGCQGDLSYDFLDNLPAGMELAIGGGNIFEMAANGLESFLVKCKERNIFPNTTINQIHLSRNDCYPVELPNRNDEEDFLTAGGSSLNSKYMEEKALNILARWINEGLIYGVGISYNGDANDLDNIINKLQNLCHADIKNNIVIHLINGVHTYKSIEKLFNKRYKALILGYKDLRRGHAYKKEKDLYIKKNMSDNYENIHDIINGFEVLSFDNLAIKQLDLKRIFLKKEWEEFYMGDDGTHTMYIDVVDGEYAKSSTSKDRRKILDRIEDMFADVKAS